MIYHDVVLGIFSANPTEVNSSTVYYCQNHFSPLLKGSPILYVMGESVKYCDALSPFDYPRLLQATGCYREISLPVTIFRTAPLSARGDLQLLCDSRWKSICSLYLWLKLIGGRSARQFAVLYFRAVTWNLRWHRPGATEKLKLAAALKHRRGISYQLVQIMEYLRLLQSKFTNTLTPHQRVTPLLSLFTPHYTLADLGLLRRP